MLTMASAPRELARFFSCSMADRKAQLQDVCGDLPTELVFWLVLSLPRFSTLPAGFWSPKKNCTSSPRRPLASFSAIAPAIGNVSLLSRACAGATVEIRAAAAAAAANIFFILISPYGLGDYCFAAFYCW